MHELMKQLLTAKTALDRARYSMGREDETVTDWDTATEIAWLSLQVKRIVMRIESGSKNVQG